MKDTMTLQDSGCIGLWTPFSRSAGSSLRAFALCLLCLVRPFPRKPHCSLFYFLQVFIQTSLLAKNTSLTSLSYLVASILHFSAKKHFLPPDIVGRLSICPLSTPLAESGSTRVGVWGGLFFFTAPSPSAYNSARHIVDPQ